MKETVTRYTKITIIIVIIITITMIIVIIIKVAFWNRVVGTVTGVREWCIQGNVVHFP